MGPEQVQELCAEILAKGPDITSATAWTDGSRRPSGLLISFSSGARLWIGITTANATSAEPAQTTSSAPPLPQLYDAAGKITPPRAELYLAAVLMSAHAPEIASAYGYSASPGHPGVGLHLTDGGRAFLPFVFTAAHGKKPAARPFTVDAAF
ncbi:hypothetical protein [Streptomyces sp. NBC_00582]|uniref:hypothetical protein n=1 Tax=Streptomyces sp. NBC_00582 TaxID=2975783 RepID=UPI002E810ED6|nr:hypothetical protein [Streptomyces sp. NBC_00582]WUB68306.1 hypothetical protein OG852_49220 [Streptomyces sp. NBC_00582]